ncbi:MULTISPECIES: ethanolamine utilization protein EutJ [Clostridium]|uniref:Ethanolamine utilization protein EutJ n=1 Tax=Clostridium cadaveris TaxID=1529 RepID=A0A1I2K488_9CLOT|nr:ethanolamine utilization protein EutJ [Clostridium cadaveris]MDU4950886.1 ethanolamine utilization protein EutJ [Clostridium sp.]MDM8310873.1 ethanolamine utilization protein EutJ [Clostridium cadaveris]MDY4949166.1 ethanolamine utilization protein EutJ [Clostridium cadaveris]NME63365.1 ethanolamine utilization protein EutJ [Clostridium cadaveris]NWK11490.1 ethanolamine utilization protein EutJ [Clostridium cadaveris]
MLINNDILAEFSELIRENKCNSFSGILKTGVDLGTANIVISVVDENNRPIAGVTEVSKVVKDGVVVDFVGGIQAIKRLKARLEDMLGVTLETAATAIPPGIIDGNVRCISNVIEGAGFEVTNVIDEPSAAATVLGIKDGAVVDVGGGTTGISIIKDGNVIFTADEPTGGTHMTLVLAGYYGISIEEAEEIKKDITRENDVFPIIKPVVEKMASIVKGFLSEYDVDDVYVVGGAACFNEFESTFEKQLGIRTIKPNDALLVTPLGIAWNA